MDRQGLSLLLLLAAGCTPAIAATPAGDPRVAAGERRAELLERIDANHDGALAAGEIDAAAREHAQAVDGDHDGVVTVEEMRTFREARHGERQARRLARIDTNHDGNVTVEELAAFRTRLAMRFDTDGDGAISPAERELAREQLRERRTRRLAD